MLTISRAGELVGSPRSYRKRTSSESASVCVARMAFPYVGVGKCGCCFPGPGWSNLASRAAEYDRCGLFGG